VNPDRASLSVQDLPQSGATEVVWCWHRRAVAHRPQPVERRSGGPSPGHTLAELTGVPGSAHLTTQHRQLVAQDRETVEAPTRWPSPASSPWMRRYPQSGFSEASP
jgi:hypothetical protein